MLLMHSDEERGEQPSDDDDRRDEDEDDDERIGVRRRGISSSVDGGDVVEERASSIRTLDRDRLLDRPEAFSASSRVLAPLSTSLVRVADVCAVESVAGDGRRSPSPLLLIPPSTSYMTPEGLVIVVDGVICLELLSIGSGEVTPSIAGVSSGDVQLLHSAQGLLVPLVSSSPLLLNPLHGSILEQRDDKGEGVDVEWV